MELNPHRTSCRRSTPIRSSSSASSSSSSFNDPRHDTHPLPMLNKTFTGAMAFVTCLLLQATATVGSNQLAQDRRSGLICWTCSNKSSNDECNDWAPNVMCQSNQTLCKTIHRLDAATERSLSVSKFCASVDECRIDLMGCRSASHSSYSSSSASSYRKTSQLQQMECESCCDSSYCNEDVPNNDTTAKFMSMALLSAHNSVSSAQYRSPATSSPSWTTMLTIALTIIVLFRQQLHPLSKDSKRQR